MAYPSGMLGGPVPMNQTDMEAVKAPSGLAPSGVPIDWKNYLMNYSSCASTFFSGCNTRKKHGFFGPVGCRF